jgi:hypothetical protein
MKKIRTRIASKAESLKWLNTSVPVADRQAMELPDGSINACRLIMYEKGGPVLNKDGSLQYCAPWLLAGVFSV